MLKLLADGNKDIEHTCVGEIMHRDPTIIASETPTQKALELMNARHDSCLLVVENGKLVGMVTECDFTKITAALLQTLDENC